MGIFLDRKFLPASALAKITEVRVTDPECSARAATTRKRRSNLTLDGKLNILIGSSPTFVTRRAG